MFASASSSQVSRRQAGAYTQVYAATGASSASAHGLISMLFDGAITSIAEARGAIRSRNVSAKIRAIGRALRIVDEGLCASLNDAEGGVIARDLRSLYGYITVRLAQANLNNDETALEECARLLEPLRSAWLDIAPKAA